MEYSQKMFASDDSSTVKKVFIADMAGNTVLLQRGEGGWQLDDGTPATNEMVQSMLSLMHSTTWRASKRAFLCEQSKQTSR